MDWINDEGGFNTEAADMPEGMKTLITNKGLTDVEGLGEIYTNAEKKLGVDPKRLVTIPDKPDDVDGWNNLTFQNLYIFMIHNR